MLERRLGVAELRAGAHDLDEVVPAQVLHRDEVLVVDVADVVDLHDVRVIERRSDARLVEEHAHELGILRAVAEDALDDEILLEPLDRLRTGQEDLGHAARRQAGDKLVLAKGHGLEGHGDRLIVAFSLHCRQGGGT